MPIKKRVKRAASPLRRVTRNERLLGSALALVTTSALAVVGAGFLVKFVNPTYLRVGSGVLFIVIGILILWKK